MSKPIVTVIRQSEGPAMTTATAFDVLIPGFSIEDFKSFRLSLLSSATGSINIQVQVAPYYSSSDTSLDTWIELPTTTVDMVSTIAANTFDAPNCAVEVNTWRYLRVQARISATAVTASIGSVKLFVTGERK